MITAAELRPDSRTSLPPNRGTCRRFPCTCRAHAPLHAYTSSSCCLAGHPPTTRRLAPGPSQTPSRPSQFDMTSRVKARGARFS